MIKIRMIICLLVVYVLLGLVACHRTTPTQDETMIPIQTPTLQQNASPTEVVTTKTITAKEPATMAPPTSTATPTPTTIPTVSLTPTRRPTSTPTSTLIPPIERISGTLVLVAVRTSDIVSSSSSTPQVSNLVLVDARSGALTQLTEGNYRDVNPSWSPDGQRIAFSSNRTGQFEIHVINRDGTDLVQVTNEVGDKSYPTWSPDGKRLAFISRVEQESYSAIRIIDLETREIATVVQRPWSIAPIFHSLDWSPVDESLLLFYGNDSWTWKEPGASEPSSQLGPRDYVLDLRTGKETLITPDGWTCDIPVWSPTGTMVLQNCCNKLPNLDGCSPIVSTLTTTETGLSLGKARVLDGIITGWADWSPNGEFWAARGWRGEIGVVEIHEVRPYMTYQAYEQDGISIAGLELLPVHRVESEIFSLTQPDWGP